MENRETTLTIVVRQKNDGPCRVEVFAGGVKLGYITSLHLEADLEGTDVKLTFVSPDGYTPTVHEQVQQMKEKVKSLPFVRVVPNEP